MTGLRAIAAIAVVLSHTGVPASCPAPLRKATEWGYVGVPMFFMLSGVVLAYNYGTLTPAAGWRAVLRFYVARMARVMPLYWVMILFCVVANVAGGKPQYHAALIENILAVQTWGADIDTAQYRYNGPGWSIGAELFFYVLFPFVVPLVRGVWDKRRVRGVSALIAGCVAVTFVLCLAWVTLGWASLPGQDGRSAHRWLYRNPLPHLAEFVIGICLSFLIQGSRALSARRHTYVQMIVLVVVGGVATLHPVGHPSVIAASYGALFVAPFAVLIWSLSSGRGFLARFLSKPLLMSLGVSSYALYLTHVPVLSQVAAAEGIRTGAASRSWAALLVTLTLMLLVAEGAHRSVEVPCRRVILRRLGRRDENSVHEAVLLKERSRYRESRRS